MFNTIGKTWKPDTVVLTSSRLSDTLTKVTDIGWMTYKKQITKEPKLSNNITHKPDYKGGHLFHLKTDSGLAYDYEMLEQLNILKDSF